MRRVILMLLLAGSVYAEPTPTVQWLMNEPLTLWDWGMIKTREHLEEWLNLGDRDVNWSVSVVYDWDASQIDIELSKRDTNNAFSAELTKIQCRSGVNGVRYRLDIDPNSGEPFFDDSSLLARFFSHEGFTNTSRPMTVGSSLDAIVRINAKVLSGEAADDGTKIWVACEGDLRGTDIFFKD